MKPEGIPDDIWEAAMTEAAKYVEWAFQTRNVDADAEHVLATSISRMVLAERLKERERCLAVANGWLIAFGESGAALEHTTPQQWANDAVADIADAINSGSRP